MSSTRERRHHPVTPLSPSFLNRLWSSVRPGGLSTVKNHANGVKRRLTRSRKTPKKPKNEPRRRMISAPRPVTVTDWTDWYDVGQMTRDTPPDNALQVPPQRRVTIDMLPGDALLVIFGFYLDDSDTKSKATSTDGWHTLVHVCQKWRTVVFRSPHRLNLQLRCTPRTPVKRMLDIWPPLPIVIRHFGLAAVTAPASEWGMHNLITALQHNADRVCQIALRPIPGWQWGKFMAAMSHPFPELTHLRLKSDDERETPPVVPDSFLGGSATTTPRLRFLWLERVPFPGLPNLLLSAADLVDLRLWEIPHLDPESQRLPSSTRSVLPALTRFWFRGTSEYLEDLVAQIDAPLLHGLFICFFHQPIFDTPQLSQFIGRTPTLRLNNQSQMLCFSDWGASVIFLREGTSDRALQLGILCGQPDRQLSSLAQVCTSSFPYAFVPAVEHLSVLEETLSPPHWKDDTVTEHSQWLKLLHPFTAVKNLYLSKEFAPRIAPSLQELVGGRATEALPALQKLFLEEIHPSRPAQKAIGKFVAARRLSDHPITISHWEREGRDRNDED